LGQVLTGNHYNYGELLIIVLVCMCV